VIRGLTCTIRRRKKIVGILNASEYNSNEALNITGKLVCDFPEVGQDDPI
jgi:hypothetical protein